MWVPESTALSPTTENGSCTTDRPASDPRVTGGRVSLRHQTPVTARPCFGRRTGSGPKLVGTPLEYPKGLTQSPLTLGSTTPSIQAPVGHHTIHVCSGTRTRVQTTRKVWLFRPGPFPSMLTSHEAQKLPPHVGAHPTPLSQARSPGWHPRAFSPARHNTQPRPNISAARPA